MPGQAKGPALPGAAASRELSTEVRSEATLLKEGALQNAIFSSANLSSIATDANGVIQIFNVGAQRMLGYLPKPISTRELPTLVRQWLETGRS